MKQQKIDPLQTHLRRITQRHDPPGIIDRTRKILGNSRLWQRLSDRIVISRNQNHVHMFRDLPDKLRRQPILLVNVRDFQVHFLSGIHSNPVYEITANQNIFDPVRNMPLLWTADIPLQPGQDPAKSILHEHLTPDVNIRYQNRIDLLASAPRFVIRNLWQHNILGDQQLPGTLPRLQKQYLISRNPIRLLPFLHHHANKSTSSIRPSSQSVRDRPSTPSVNPLSE